MLELVKTAAGRCPLRRRRMTRLRTVSLGAWAISSIGSVVAEIDEVVIGKRAARLLQPATRDKAAKVDGLKSEALDQPLDE
jgi:hypothetical protein